MATVAAERTLLKKGAEASLYLAQWHGKRVVVKARLPKKYRPEQLDFLIRRQRTVKEPQLMHEAKRAGVSTPTIFMVDVENAAITMSYIEGVRVKQLLDRGVPETGQRDVCVKMGEAIAKLHRHGVVHGDLTTSNMILASDGRVFLVDFGLGDKSAELEAQGVDLHLMKRALQSTHFAIADGCFGAVLEGYANVVGAEGKERVLEKIREIERRGRYVAERRQEV